MIVATFCLDAARGAPLTTIYARDMPDNERGCPRRFQRPGTTEVGWLIRPSRLLFWHDWAATHNARVERPPAWRPHLIPRVMRRPEVEACTGLSRSTLYAMMAEGEFPPPIRLGKRAVGWSAAAISDWLDSRKPRDAA